MKNLDFEFSLTEKNGVYHERCGDCAYFNKCQKATHDSFEDSFDGESMMIKHNSIACDEFCRE